MSAERVAALIRRAGQTVTLRRDGSPDVQVKASMRLYRPDEIAGTILQGDREIVVSEMDLVAAGFPSPPGQQDQVVAGGAILTVQFVETRSWGETVALHVITARG